ncbi:Nitric Oxide Synthase, Endothelial [Manis pentadactyla]|nr:Nitric Oxide Synthase, Endothelial [Manis pentadactyla]
MPYQPLAAPSWDLDFGVSGREARAVETHSSGSDRHKVQSDSSSGPFKPLCSQEPDFGNSIQQAATKAHDIKKKRKEIAVLIRDLGSLKRQETYFGAPEIMLCLLFRKKLWV